MNTAYKLAEPNAIAFAIAMNSYNWSLGNLRWSDRCDSSRDILEHLAQTMQSDTALTPILLIFCTYYVSGSNTLCAKYEHSKIND